MKLLARNSFFAGFGFLVAGCGSGMEPLQLVQQQGLLPSLALPISDTSLLTIAPFSQSGATTARDGIDLTPIALGTTGAQVSAPAPGVVTAIDLTTGAGVVTMMHSRHLVTRISGMQTVTVQVGANVQTGSGIGMASSLGSVPVRLSVYYDNAVMCPLGYLTYAAQKRLAQVVGISPCQ